MITGVLDSPIRCPPLPPGLNQLARTQPIPIYRPVSMHCSLPSLYCSPRPCANTSLLPPAVRTPPYLHRRRTHNNSAGIKGGGDTVARGILDSYRQGKASAGDIATDKVRANPPSAAQHCQILICTAHRSCHICPCPAATGTPQASPTLPSLIPSPKIWRAYQTAGSHCLG